MKVREHFEHYDARAGIENLLLFAPGVDLVERQKAARWHLWSRLFYHCLAVMKEPVYADHELAEPFEPADYQVFYKIMYAGFQRFQKKNPGVRVPEVYYYAVKSLQRLRDSVPADQK